MSRLVYFFIYLGMWLLASLPMKALYVLSDVLYVLMYKLARYRRRVVWRNLKNSFPEKTEKELLAIERKFYHYICDYMLESLKMLKMPVDSVTGEVTDVVKYGASVAGALLVLLAGKIILARRASAGSARTMPSRSSTS